MVHQLTDIRSLADRIPLAVMVAVMSVWLADCSSDDPTKSTGSLGLSCSVSPENGRAPLTISFSAVARGLSDKEKEGVRYHWSFGDGTTASVASGTKQFNGGGTYNVTLTAAAPDGSQGSWQKTIQVESDLRIESCSADPSSGNAPLVVRFQSRIVGNGQNPTTYAWDFGDGGVAGDAQPSHTYQAVGSYTARLSAQAAGSSAQCTVAVAVLDSLGVTCSASPTSGSAPLSVSLDASADGGGGSCTYSWDFDDGGTSDQKSPTHRYDYGRRYEPTATVTCGARRGSCRQTVEVIGPPPTATPTPSPTPTPTPTPVPTPTPTPDCSGVFTFRGTGTPAAGSWPLAPIGLPVTLTGLPPGCRVRTGAYRVSLTSDVDLSTLSTPGPVCIEIYGGIIRQRMVRLVTTDAPSNVPATFSGTEFGSSCGSLTFALGAASFATATPPYNGTYAPQADRMPGQPTDGASGLNGQTFYLSAWAGHATGNRTVSCWEMDLTLEPQ